MAAIPFLDTCNIAFPQHSAAINPHEAERRYHILNIINKGAYGVVYRAWDNSSGQMVAIKHELHGVSPSTVREIEILESLPPHPSIVGFKEVVVDEHRRVLVVMEYLHTDLHRLIRQKTRMPFTLCEIKSMMRQILEGVGFLHENGVMHRDLKPANILINDKAQLKICDFGLSRQVVAGGGSYTPGVVTQWYRAPELLLGCTTYTPAIDMWSVGCVMAELLLGQVLFPGNSEIHQLCCIHQNLGASCGLLLRRLAAAARCGGAAVLTAAGLDLLLRLLKLDPNKRITAKEALDHAWFREFYGLRHLEEAKQ